MKLVARNLSKIYGGKQVVKDVSLTLYPGEVLGMLGPNGAGKSTTVGMLYGLAIPSQGSVYLEDINIQNQGPQARFHMGIVTQDDNLDPDFNVIDNLLQFARHYRLTGRAAQMRVSELISLVGLDGREKYKVDTLSGGYKRRLVLARALLNKPQIVFLDEPTTGLDPDARQDFWRLVSNLRESGCGVLLTTHYMDEAERLCDRLLLMQQGQIVDEGTPQELIDRTIGKEVIEVEGIDTDWLKEFVSQAGVWSRTFSSGFLIVLPEDQPHDFIHQIEQKHPTRLNHRRANLEDVFLRLTGEML